MIKLYLSLTKCDRTGEENRLFHAKCVFAIHYSKASRALGWYIYGDMFFTRVLHVLREIIGILGPVKRS